MSFDATTAPQTDAATGPRLPLFYRRPMPLSSVDHADWRLKLSDYAFASETAFVPLVLAEIPAASRNYPVVFAGEGAAPLALTGLDKVNLFVTDGVWTEDAYVPAYVRRYPFGFLATSDEKRFVLALDVEADGVISSGEEGRALFEDGKPTEMTTQALSFCDTFQGEAAATTAFAEALQASGLLIERRADVTLPDGRKLGVDGFQIVDAEKFAMLDDAVVLEWQRKGWLALIHFHLASLDRFSTLLALKARRAASVEPAAPVDGDRPATRSKKVSA